VLGKIKIKPLRVDRVEHNEDIDDKIFSLIKESDICIADLTNARPSVYYEAGFASGLGKPVVYISKADHFRPRENDRFGNFRIHFDLQMKNIIRWSTPNNKFKEQLNRRLHLVVRPLKKAQAHQAKIELSRKEFLSLSQNDQLAALLQKGRQILFLKGFCLKKLERNPLIRRLGYPEILERFRARDCEQIYLVFQSSVSKAELKFLPCQVFFQSQGKNTKIDECISICVIASLHPIRQSTIRKALPSYASYSEGIFSKRLNDISPGKLHFSIVVTLDGFKSIPEFAEKLKERINELKLG
jgi:nucleoside 2-deoxyribosyltransferase